MWKTRTRERERMRTHRKFPNKKKMRKNCIERASYVLYLRKSFLIVVVFWPFSSRRSPWWCGLRAYGLGANVCMSVSLWMRLLVVYVNISYLVVTLHKNEQATDQYDNRRMDENAFKLRSFALSLAVSRCESWCVRECNDLGRYIESFFTLSAVHAHWASLCVRLCELVPVSCVQTMSNFCYHLRFLAILWKCVCGYFSFVSFSIPK